MERLHPQSACGALRRSHTPNHHARACPMTQPAEMDQLREWEETLAEQVGAADPSRHSRNHA